MSELIRCTICNGKKVVSRLGGMQIKCTDCDGIGHVKKKEPELPIITNQEEDTPVDDALIIDNAQAAEEIVPVPKVTKAAKKPNKPRKPGVKKAKA